MDSPSRKASYDSNTLPDLSSRKSKRASTRSYRGSISNSSVHTTSTAATRKDQFDKSENGPGGITSTCHLKSLHSLEKPTLRFRNQSTSTLSTIRGVGSVRTSTTTSTKEDAHGSPLPSTSRYNLSTLPEPSPSTSRITPSTPLDVPSNGDSQPFVTTEIPTANKPLAKQPSSLSPPTDRRIGTATNRKASETSSPSAPSNRHTPQIAVEYVKPSRQSIKEYERLLRKAEVYATVAKGPFVPLTQPRPPSSHNASKTSSSQQKATPTTFVSPTPPHPSQTNRANLSEFYVDPNPTAVLGTLPTAPLDGFPGVSFSPTPADSARGGTVITKDKKGTLSIMADFHKSHIRPKISTPYDPVHLTQAGFDSSTGESAGLSKGWKRLPKDSRISKSGQEENSFAVMEVGKFYQEGGGDVWDKIGHAPDRGISPPPPIPGAAPATYPGAPKSVDASAEGPSNSLNADDGVRSQATVASNGTVAEHPAPQQESAAVASLAKAASVTLRRREKKKKDNRTSPRASRGSVARPQPDESNRRSRSKYASTLLLTSDRDPPSKPVEEPSAEVEVVFPTPPSLLPRTEPLFPPLPTSWLSRNVHELEVALAKALEASSATSSQSASDSDTEDVSTIGLPKAVQTQTPSSSTRLRSEVVRLWASEHRGH